VMSWDGIEKFNNPGIKNVGWITCNRVYRCSENLDLPSGWAWGNMTILDIDTIQIDYPPTQKKTCKVQMVVSRPGPMPMECHHQESKVPTSNK
jgi:hypothetical protein